MFRWPAEWEPQEHIFVGWPDHQAEWGEALGGARDCTAALAATLGDQATVCVAHSPLEDVATRCGNAQVVRLDYGDIWLRDTGPVWRTHGSVRDALGFRWTGWGGSFLLSGDDEVAPQLAAHVGDTLTRSMVAVEGGGIETDGEGTCLTTRDCLLNDNRNPGMSEKDIEIELGRTLGITKTVWVERGLVNDHTDGHIDNLARFVAPGIAVVARSTADDPNHAIHREVERALGDAGLSLEFVPSPGVVVDSRDGSHMPASHLNFVIANRVVCVPTFDKETDDEALAALERLFPGRVIVGINASALLYGGGALHCMTNHLPAI